MRIYYVGESRSRSLSVATALGVDGEAWDAVSENIQDGGGSWRTSSTSPRAGPCAARTCCPPTEASPGVSAAASPPWRRGWIS